MDGIRNSWKRFLKQTEAIFTEEDSNLIQGDYVRHQKVAILGKSEQAETSRAEVKNFDSDSECTAIYESITSYEKNSLKNDSENSKNEVTFGSLVEKLCSFTTSEENVELIRNEPVTASIDDSIVQIMPRTRKKKTQTSDAISICDTCKHSDSKVPLIRLSESSDSQFSSSEEWLLEMSPDVELKISEMRLKMYGMELSPKKESPLSDLMHRCRDLIWAKRTPEKIRVPPVFVSSGTQTEIISQSRSASGLKEVAKALSS